MCIEINRSINEVSRMVTSDTKKAAAFTKSVLNMFKGIGPIRKTGSANRIDWIDTKDRPDIVFEGVIKHPTLGNIGIHFSSSKLGTISDVHFRFLNRFDGFIDFLEDNKKYFSKMKLKPSARYFLPRTLVPTDFSKPEVISKEVSNFIDSVAKKWSTENKSA